MARILAVDTTSELGSLALMEDDQIVEEVTMRAPEGFSTAIYREIESLLGRHHWPLESIDCFAGAAGPGSFTGVRVSLTTVKGLAEASGKAAIGISNLQALAALGHGPARAVWIDARRGEVYGGVYSDELQPLAPEIVAPIERWQASLPPGAVILAGAGIPLAAAVARIALVHYRTGAPLDPAAVDANYVRRPDAESLFKPV